MSKTRATRTISAAYSDRPMREVDTMTLRERHRRHRLAHPNDASLLKETSMTKGNRKEE